MTCTHATLRALNAGVCVLCDVPAPDPFPSTWAEGVYDAKPRLLDPPHAPRLQAVEPDPPADEGPSADELERDLYRRSFPDFARRFWPVMVGLPYPENAATEALGAALQAVADGRIWRLLIAIAPGIGKSTMLALYSAWRLARRRDWRSLHAMTGQADANRESLRVRRLVLHDEYTQLFQLPLQPDEQSVQAWATQAGGRYYALGRDGAVTSKRVLEAVIDDLMTAAERHSKSARDEVWTWLDESAKSRVDGDRGPILIIAQRLDRDDIHARCLASGEHWCLLEPAAERDGRGLELRDHAGNLVWADKRAPGELIAPQMLSREKLAGLSKSVRTTQYQQRPDEDDGGASIARVSWRFHAPAGANPAAARPYGCVTPDVAPTVETPTHYDRTVISIDPTFGGTKTSNDYASITVWGSVGFGRYLLERWKKRSKQREQREQLKVLRAKYPDAIILIEKAAGGDGMIEELCAPTSSGGEGWRECPKGERPRPGDVVGVTVGSQTGGKAARLDNVSPTIDQGFAYLPIGMPDLQDFVDELAGLKAHDDEMDSTSQALHFLNTSGNSDAQDLERRLQAMKIAAASVSRWRGRGVLRGFGVG